MKSILQGFVQIILGLVVAGVLAILMIPITILAKVMN